MATLGLIFERQEKAIGGGCCNPCHLRVVNPMHEIYYQYIQ